MRILPADETAERLGVALRSILDKRYRARIGLRAIKIGRRIGFDERDIEKLIARGREKLPTLAGG
jgi:predicted DNA-binding transcriptional regulator AlpA